MKFHAVSLLFLASACAVADQRTAKTHMIGGFFGQSALILGSEDVRTGGGFSYAYGRPEPRFQLWSIPAQFVVEGYFDHTNSGGASGTGANDTFSIGGLTYGRWRWPVSKDGYGVYADLGFGIQAANQETVDLNSWINTTPMAGFGGVFQFGSQELLLGIRLLHISNGGTRQPNQGQNQIFATVAVRF